ncbi:hypothetical protein D3C87_1053930 [compost metagenome]
MMSRPLTDSPKANEKPAATIRMSTSGLTRSRRKAHATLMNGNAAREASRLGSRRVASSDLSPRASLFTSASSVCSGSIQNRGSTASLRLLNPVRALRAYPHPAALSKAEREILAHGAQGGDNPRVPVV